MKTIKKTGKTKVETKTMGIIGTALGKLQRTLEKKIIFNAHRSSQKWRKN